MSSSLREIKTRIKAIKNTSSITQAMYNISASKIRKATDMVENYTDFMIQLNSVFYGTGAIVGDHPLINPVRGNRVVYVLITSDRGLAGGYHSQLFKYFLEDYRKHIGEHQVLVIGKKGHYFAKKQELNIINKNIIVNRDDISLIDFRKEAKLIRDMFMNNEVDEIVVYYTHYVSGAVQRPKKERILPIPVSLKAIEKSKDVFYTYDTNPIIMLENVSSLHVESTIYGAIADAKLSEHSSRMQAMHSATDNAKDIVKKLDMVYHRARQQQITNELIDIVNGSKI